MDNFWVYFNFASERKKITFPSDSKGEHYTVRFWERHLDVHHKNENATTEAEKYSTLIELRYYTLLRLFVYSKYFLPRLMLHRLFESQINLGKLKKNQIVLMELAGDPVEAPPFIKVSKDRIKLKNNADFTDYSPNWISADELGASTKVVFMAYAFRRGGLKRQGYVFAIPLGNEKKYFLLKESFFQRLSMDVIYHLLEFMHKHEFQGKKELVGFLMNTTIMKKLLSEYQ